MSIIENSLKFSAVGWDENSFNVNSFSGEEAMSSLYHFDIELTTDDYDIDVASLLNAEASFTITVGEQAPQFFHGILSKVSIQNEIDDRLCIKVQLVPKLWALTLGVGSQLFLEQSVPDVIATVLDDRDCNGIVFTYQINMSQEYDKQDFICKYNESAFGFISRLMEQEGIFYYFEQLSDKEVLHISDTKMIHQEKPDTNAIIYGRGAGQQTSMAPELVTEFNVNIARQPKDVLLKGYLYSRPDLPPEGKAQVSDTGIGRVYCHGDRFLCQSHADKLATIKAEQLNCVANTHFGHSSVSWLQPGYLFNLKGYMVKSVDQQYLLIGIKHEGRQASEFNLNIDDKKDYYTNRFSCIPASLPYRDQLKTARPVVNGTIHAVIDAASSSAMLDDEGRYKVKFPFDLSDTEGGQASYWVRMAQPYGGSGHGMHFPLLKGTEVILTFEEGDPDRPLILSTAPNPENPSLVTDSNSNQNVIQSASGNQMVMDDSSSGKSITLKSEGATITFGNFTLD
ncbi:type VI secretion system Vgr family protein [Shewanella surugensis]|uniref:Type VI secretion system tip protein VgrG n=1 Tax=Shewanella surugensis TaxID=212020 RepID=A0ABT0L8G6_9GAMM|nr:type VI secretion system tip protein TssI/VgrG [Shewanella surugensis]MCL1123471.1 type VI secretion system tip protein VgrG [Shewanella surugensis]